MQANIIHPILFVLVFAILLIQNSGCAKPSSVHYTNDTVLFQAIVPQGSSGCVLYSRALNIGTDTVLGNNTLESDISCVGEYELTRTFQTSNIDNVYVYMQINIDNMPDSILTANIYLNRKLVATASNKIVDSVHYVVH